MWKGTWNAVALARPSDKHYPIKCDVVNENDSSRRAQMHSIRRNSSIDVVTYWLHSQTQVWGILSLISAVDTFLWVISHAVVLNGGVWDFKKKKREICEISVQFQFTQWFCSWVFKNFLICFCFINRVGDLMILYHDWSWRSPQSAF